MARIKRKFTLQVKQLSNVEIKKLTSYLDDYDIKLTTKQRNFAYYYVMTDMNLYEATKKAGYCSKNSKQDRKSLTVVGSENLTKPIIKKAIDLIIKHEIQLEKSTLELSLFKKLVAVIEMDILDFLEEDGTVKKKISDIPKPIRQMIKKTEVKYYGKDAKVKVLTLEFIGKEWAFDKLMKYINMIKDTQNINIVTVEAKQNLLNMFIGKK